MTMSDLKPCEKRDCKTGQYKSRHGMYGTRLYHIWNGLTGRCNNPNNKDYANYGGRGISVCKEWQKPENFFGWAFLNGYSEDLTLDRIDTNGNYCPENCRWITNDEQQRNRRNNKILEFDGQRHCVSEWAEITGIPKGTISSRIRYGWTIEEVMTIEPSHKNSRRRKHG